jgi:uncharacterized protein (TIGR03435 family)
MARPIVFIALPVLVGVLNVHVVRAQSLSFTGTANQFDVVSIKPCTPGDGPGSSGRGGERISPRSLSIECRTVKSLIQEAFLVGGESSAEFGPRSVAQWNGGGHGSMTTQTATAGDPSLRLIREPIEGGPDWLDSDLYTIEAKSERSQDLGMMTGPMLQALLEDRFKVRVHRDRREVPAYLLAVAEDGPRLRPAAEGSCLPSFWNHPPALGSHPAQPSCGSFRNTGTHAIEAFATMANLCAQFSVWLDREVADKTGLSGMFEARLPFSSADLKPGPLARQLSGENSAAPSAPGANSVQLISSAALRLGLKLEIGENSSDVLVVDHVERPAGN